MMVHVQRGGYVVRLSDVAATGAAHIQFLQRDDIGIGAAYHIGNALRADHAVAPQAAMDVIGHDMKR